MHAREFLLLPRVEDYMEIVYELIITLTPSCDHIYIFVIFMIFRICLQQSQYVIDFYINVLFYRHPSF